MGAGADRADLGHLRRSEAARERKLALVAHLLAAKDQNRMLLKSRARRRIRGVVICDLVKRHTTQLGAKARTQRDDFHRRVLRSLFAA